MKTLTINGQTFIVVDADAMKKIADSDLNMDYNSIQNIYGFQLVSSKSENVVPASIYISASPIHNSDGTDVVSGIVDFYESHHDGRVVLSHIDNGINDDDAATVGQLNAAVGDIENALDRIIAIQESLIGGESA